MGRGGFALQLYTRAKLVQTVPLMLTKAIIMVSDTVPQE